MERHSNLIVWKTQYCWRGCGEIGTLLHCWWECKLVQPLWKTVCWLLKDLEPEIPFDPAIPLLGMYPRDYKSFCYKDTCIRMFFYLLISVSSFWILDSRLLSDAQFVNIFSRSVGYLFTSLTLSLTVQKFFSLNRYHLPISVFLQLLLMT